MLPSLLLSSALPIVGRVSVKFCESNGFPLLLFFCFFFIKHTWFYSVKCLKGEIKVKGTKHHKTVTRTTLQKATIIICEAQITAKRCTKMESLSVRYALLYWGDSVNNDSNSH